AGEDPRVPLQAQGRAQAGGGGGHQRQGPRPRPRQPQRQGAASEQEEEQEGGHLQPRVSLRLPQRDGRVLRNTRFGGDGGRPQPAVQHGRLPGDSHVRLCRGATYILHGSQRPRDAG
ncbi:unnamed protein product, partial [Ectocarpus fasciculatus]